MSSGGFGEVPEGSGADSLVRFRRVLVQMLCESPKGSDFFNGIST